MTPEKCDCCGKFMSYKRGSSWSQCWHYEMDGLPTLDDTKWRCDKCTEKFGIGFSNCANPENYRGIVT